MGAFKQKTKDLLFSLSPLKEFVSFSKLGNHGRLGNQLFQYAAIKSYSIKNRLPLILPPANEHRISDFNIDFISKSVRWIEFASDYNYCQTEFNYNPIIFNYHKRIDIEGFFQTEKYFIDIQEEIQRDFTIKDEKIINASHQIITKIKNKYPGRDLVGIHVRRGDTVPSKTAYGDKYIGSYSPDKALKHPLIQHEYYETAMNQFSNCIFLFFSDTEKDIKWCEEKFGNSNNHIYLHYSDLQDLMLMQLCDHNIISNSSFSWWAAWLNNNPERRVISPNKNEWFGVYYSHYNMEDLIPEAWEQL